MKRWFFSKNKADQIAWSFLFLASLFFLGKQVPYLLKGDQAHFTDATSEQYIFSGARNFAELGWGRTHFLPQYDGNATETPVEQLREQKVYTHFLPGPDYWVGIFYELTGVNGHSRIFARIATLIVFFFSLLFFVLVTERELFSSWRWAKVFLFLGVALSPGIYKWSVSLFGHSFSSASILIAWSLGLLIQTERWKRWIAAFVVGMFSNLFLLEGAFVVFAAPWVATLLHPKHPSWKRGLELSFFVGLGLVGIWFIHLAQIATFLDSWSLAWTDQIGTALQRGEHREGPTRIQMLGRMSDWVGGHFRIDALAMWFFGVFFAWLLPGSPSRRRRFWMAMTLAMTAAYLFPLAMLHHTVIHQFRVPRLFFLPFLTFLILLVLTVYNRSRRSL